MYDSTTMRAAAMASTMKMTIGTAVLAMSIGCASVADTTRTGRIHEVRFAETMTPNTLRVEPGDEIRWINGRSMAVTLEFLPGALDSVSCEQGFSRRGLGNLRGARQESATLGPNDSASLCFTNAGIVNYNARMESAVAGGQQIEPGTIRVGR